MLHLHLGTHSGTRSLIAACTLRIPHSQGQQLHGVSQCASWWHSDRSIPAGQQSQQRRSLWEPWQTSLLAQAKMGVLLEAAVLAPPCSTRFGLPPPVPRPERVGELLLAMTQRGYFFAFRSLLLSLPFTAHHTLPCGTSHPRRAAWLSQDVFTSLLCQGWDFQPSGNAVTEPELASPL